MPFARKRRRGRDFLSASARGGYSLIELLIAATILGILVSFAIPSFNHSQTVRALDNEAGAIVMAFQTAKWRAATSGLWHRVAFVAHGEAWAYRVEREDTPGTWTLLPGTIEKGVSAAYAVAVNLPTSLMVVFRPTGLVANYETSKDTIALTSSKLQSLGEPGVRTIRVFAGGSVLLTKS